MGRPLDIAKQQHWLDLIRRWQQSPLTVRAFCDRHGLAEARFYLWRRVLRERGLLHDPPTPTQRTPSSPPPAFVKLTVNEPPLFAHEQLDGGSAFTPVSIRPRCGNCSAFWRSPHAEPLLARPGVPLHLADRHAQEL